MKNYIVVSTYPESGSKNIGDQLITNALIDCIKYQKGAEVTIKIIWRAADWSEVEFDFKEADVIIFACLAIRPNMVDVEYPYIKNLLSLDIPLAVVSSGTSLDVSGIEKGMFDYVSEKTREMLIDLDKKSLFFSTRGYLTQAFCRKLDLKNSRFSGDVAFFNKKNTVSKFKSNQTINKIVISDPHYSLDYISSFNTLYLGIRELFPSADIVIALHGNDPTVIKYAIENNIKYECIYEQKNEGLNLYDSADLHVGYRVHAHVSSLKRGMYSYLLEQDGRGCDYGLSIERKISVPNYRYPKTYMQRLLSRLLCVNIKNVSDSPAEQIVAMISEDKSRGFNKFNGLDVQISSFSESILEDISKLP